MRSPLPALPPLYPPPPPPPPWAAVDPNVSFSQKYMGNTKRLRPRAKILQYCQGVKEASCGESMAFYSVCFVDLLLHALFMRDTARGHNLYLRGWPNMSDSTVPSSEQVQSTGIGAKSGVQTMHTSMSMTISNTRLLFIR